MRSLLPDCVRQWLMKPRQRPRARHFRIGVQYSLLPLNRVTGSDVAESPAVQRLRGLAVKVNIGHRSENVERADVVVVSSAIDEHNPEVMSARERHIPVIPRAEMLGELMRFQKGIAVAGTHGKTTTTSIVAQLLTEANLDPTFIVGGLVNAAGGNAKLGHGEHVVAEADESDASFLNLKPEMVVVTNIDEDHMTTYQGNLQSLKDSFISFIQNIPFYGLAVLCEEDDNIRSIYEDIHKPIVTYGFRASSQFQVFDIEQNGKQMIFSVRRPKPLSTLTSVSLPMPGKHNVLNAVAAIAIASHLGVDDQSIVQGISSFQGIGRRFEILGDILVEGKQVTVVDDYAHHPVELAATLSAAHSCWQNRRIVVLFQPHRYSRTYDLFDDFVHHLSSQHPLLLAEVYAANEEPISTATSKSLCTAIHDRGSARPIYIADLSELDEILAGVLQHGDVLLSMGAGDIGRIVNQYVDTKQPHGDES